MDEETKKILEDIRQAVEGLGKTANDISNYLTWLRKQEAERRAIENHPATTIHPASDYLAGRQRRRDGDKFFVPSPGGTDGTKAEGPRRR